MLQKLNIRGTIELLYFMKFKMKFQNQGDNGNFSHADALQFAYL